MREWEQRQFDFSALRPIFQAKAWHTGAENLPPAVAEWLLHTDSLTQKLQQICTSITVEITQQGWIQGGRSEPKIAKNAQQWLREVVLKGDEKPYLFAQTILPKSTVDAVASDVLTLGEMPIGLWLFPQNPTRQRLEWRQDPETQLYARRSLLTLHDYPLEIYELFLPDFPFASQK